MGGSQITLVMVLLMIFTGGPDSDAQVPERIYGSKSRESNRLLELAKEKMTLHQYQSALGLLNQSLQYQTDNIDAYFNRAMVKEQMQDPDGALTDYQIVLLLDSTYREAAFNRAKLRYLMKQYQRSIEDFRKVLNMSSNGTQALYFKGTQLNKEGEVSMHAITTAASGMDADIHNYLGLCYQALDENQSAISSFNKALLVDQGEANYYVNRGISHVILGKSEQAIADFKSALILDPDHAIAQFNLTQEMEKSGHLEISVYDQLIENNPEFTSAYVNRALARLNSGDTEGAILDYSEAIIIDPHDPVLYVNRALALEKAGRLNKALADFNRALELDEANATAYRGRGRVLFSLESYQLALSDMNQAINLEPGHAASYFNRALIHRKTGNTVQACADLDHAVELGMDQAQEALKAYCKDISVN